GSQRTGRRRRARGRTRTRPARPPDAVRQKPRPHDKRPAPHSRAAGSCRHDHGKHPAAQRHAGGADACPARRYGIIYESRPNVTIDAAALCLKSGNAAILRGGSEAVHSNIALGDVVQAGLRAAALPAEAVQVVNTTDRAAVGKLITMTEHIDVIVPRGGKGLIARLANEARVPLIKHLDGNCHVYIDAAADPEKALAIALNAKTYRYGIWGAMETLLVDAGVAVSILPRIAAALAAHGVELRGCPRTRDIVPAATPATDEDWATEYLAPILAVRIVDSLDEAIEHIARWGSGHTDAIVTEDLSAAQRFQREVDSSSVYVNLPTCFADGFEYGLGAEIGISTNRLH